MKSYKVVLLLHVAHDRNCNYEAVSFGKSGYVRVMQMAGKEMFKEGPDRDLTRR